jgi:hypothetical protein
MPNILSEDAPRMPEGLQHLAIAFGQLAVGFRLLAFCNWLLACGFLTIGFRCLTFSLWLIGFRFLDF